jgi:hypothetical protein
MVEDIRRDKKEASVADLQRVTRPTVAVFFIWRR